MKPKWTELTPDKVREIFTKHELILNIDVMYYVILEFVQSVHYHDHNLDMQDAYKDSLYIYLYGSLKIERSTAGQLTDEFLQYAD